jgi:hypothetical protein
LIPAEWSSVFCDSYVRHVASKAAKQKRSIPENDIRQSLVVLLASLLWRASQLPAAPIHSAPN